MIEKGQVDVIIGAQRGDEAKARWVVDELESGMYVASVRFNGADNAGHTSDVDGDPISLHQLPMGVLFPNTRNLITRASYVNPITLLGEIEYIRKFGLEVTEDNLGISDTAHLITPGHVYLDNLREDGDEKQGSTGKGISFVAGDKYERTGVRVEDIFIDSDRIEEIVIRGIEKANRARKEAQLPEVDTMETWKKWYKQAKGIARYVTDTTVEVREILDEGGMIIAEGAQAIGLDIHNGPYPYVTSSSCGVSGVQEGLGISRKEIGNVYGAVKAIKSSVGAPLSAFPTHYEEEFSAQIRGKEGEIDTEQGKSTGRDRDMGRLDIPEIRSAVTTQGIDEIFLAKLDWVPKVGPTTLVAESYSRGSQIVEIAPGDSINKLSKVKPNYIELPTWEEPIIDIRSFEDLPVNAQRFVTAVESLIGIPITKIGVGPKRGQVINRKTA